MAFEVRVLQRYGIFKILFLHFRMFDNIFYKKKRKVLGDTFRPTYESNVYKKR